MKKYRFECVFCGSIVAESDTQKLDVKLRECNVCLCNTFEMIKNEEKINEREPIQPRYPQDLRRKL